ncbi:MAG: sulfide/dihydroorotate dehydrogenase-like FAD/NAD-binding protein [Peptococcaceae bacterium]|nr:sulfide/dihydroorotate dehydrogenase-like FAD/NAD-binding protein [Peptococcaceae bacterium]
MYNIVDYKHLGGATHELVVEAPQLAKKAKAGQFLIVRIGEGEERIPLTIADNDPIKGTITIVIQALGHSTKKIVALRPGDEVADVVGPLGQASEIEHYGTVVIVGGGVGIAPIYPIARDLKKAGNRVIAIIGAKSKELLFWEEKLAEAVDEVRIATDDGSVGHKGFVTDLLAEACDNEHVDIVWAVGPMIMMYNCVKVTKARGIRSIVSMNPIMIDGTGMCGGCRVRVGNETKFACVDGPEFDGDLIDFDLAMKRARFMRDQEQAAIERDHTCNIGFHDHKEGGAK